MKRTRQDALRWAAHYRSLISKFTSGSADYEYYRSRIEWLEYEAALLPSEDAEIPVQHIEQNAQIERKTSPDNT